jgi:hypothetical protein
MTHTQETIETVINLWNGGKNANEIAVILQMPSRSSILGILHRQRHNGRHIQVRSTDSKYLKDMRARVIKLWDFGASLKEIADQLGLKETRAKNLIGGIRKSGILIAKRRGGKKTNQASQYNWSGCLYMEGLPKSGGTFCGEATIHNSSYCQHHTILCHLVKEAA